MSIKILFVGTTAINARRALAETTLSGQFLTAATQEDAQFALQDHADIRVVVLSPGFLPLGNTLAWRLVQPGDMLGKVIYLIGDGSMMSDDFYNRLPHIVPCYSSATNGFDELLRVIREYADRLEEEALANADYQE